MSHTTPTRAAFMAFLKGDERTIRAFEELFNLVNSILYAPGDLVWSFAVARDGALYCDGSAVSRTLYPDLFLAIGTKYGAGDGTTTFNLPDMRGRTPAGLEVGTTRLTVAGCGIDGTVLGAAGGLQTNTLITSQIPVHAHTGTTGGESGHTHTLPTDVIRLTGAGSVQSGASLGHNAVAASTGASTGHTHAFTTDNAGSGAAHANVQPTIVVNPFIIY